MPSWCGLLQNKTLYKQKRLSCQLADGCMRELVVMRGHGVPDQGEEHLWSLGSFYSSQKEV
jgi:hypothetical protein